MINRKKISGERYLIYKNGKEKVGINPKYGKMVKNEKVADFSRAMCEQAKGTKDEGRRKIYSSLCYLEHLQNSNTF